MEVITSLKDMTQEQMALHGITSSDFNLKRGALKTLVNRWKYMDVHDDRYDLLLKYQLLLGEDLNGRPLTAQQKEQLWVQLKEFTAAKRARLLAVQSKGINILPPVAVRPPASAVASPQTQRNPMGLNATDAGNTGQRTSGIRGPPSSVRGNSTGSKYSSPSSARGNIPDTSKSSQMQDSNIADAGNTGKPTSGISSSPSHARGNITGSKHNSPSSARGNITASIPGASKRSQMQDSNIANAGNTGQHTSGVPTSPSSARDNSTGSKYSSPSSARRNITASTLDASQSSQMQDSNIADAGNTGKHTSGIPSSPSSARGNRTANIPDASTSSHPQDPIDLEKVGNDGNKKNQAREMKTCSEEWRRKHRCKLIVAAVVLVCLAVSTIILAVVYGNRKDSGGEETAIGNILAVSVVTEDMNSSPKEPMEPVISPQDGTGREQMQTLGTEPPEESTTATSEGTVGKRATLRPRRKTKRLKLLIAILGLFGFVIVLIIGALMMRKTQQSKSRTAHY